MKKMSRTQEYFQTLEMTRDEIMSMAVVMRGVRNNTVEKQDESALEKVVQSVAIWTVKQFVKVTVSNPAAFFVKQALKASINYLKEIDKVTMVGMMNHGITALEELADTMANNPSWQKIRVQVGMLHFVDEQVQYVTSKGSILAVLINGSWQN